MRGPFLCQIIDSIFTRHYNRRRRRATDVGATARPSKAKLISNKGQSTMQINRRQFLQYGVGASVATVFSPIVSSGLSEALADEGRETLNVVKFKLNVGATKPFTAIHISDTHFAYADERNDERKRKLAESRFRYFSKGLSYFNAAVEYAKEKDAVLLHTGDLIDFVSEKNLDLVEEVYKNDFSRFSSSGNHEFSQYVGEAREDEAYKAQSFDRVQKSFPNDLKFCSRVINGVNFVAFDDVYYYVAENLVELFQKEIDKGLPIVTMCHVPFYTPDLFKYMIVDRKEQCAYVTGAPDEAMKEYKQDRFQQQRGDEKTVKFIEWLKGQSLVKALLCGHLHCNFEGPFSDSARQYVVGGNFKGDAYEFSFE